MEKDFDLEKFVNSFDLDDLLFGGHSKLRRCNLGPKSLMIVRRVQEILKQYPGMRPTLRQIYYRLVASQQIKNSKSSYNRLSAILSQAREEGHIDPDAIEDRVRR